MQISEILATALSQHAADPDGCELDQLLADLFVLGWALRVHPIGEEQVASSHSSMVVTTAYDAPPHVFFLWMLELCVLAGAPALALIPLIPQCGHWRDLTRLGVLAEQRGGGAGGWSYLPVRKIVVETYVEQLKADHAVAVASLPTLSSSSSLLSSAASAGGQTRISDAAEHAPRKKKHTPHPSGLAKSIAALLSGRPQAPAITVASGGTPRTAVPSTGYDYHNYRETLSTIKQGAESALGFSKFLTKQTMNLLEQTQNVHT